MEQLNNLKKSLCVDVGNLSETIGVFSMQTLKTVEGLKKSVEDYAKANETRIKTLNTKNKEIEASEKHIKTLLETLMSSYTAHSALVTENTASITAGTQEELHQVGRKFLGWFRH